MKKYCMYCRRDTEPALNEIGEVFCSECGSQDQDPVNHPAHYTAGGIETIDYLQAKLTVEEFSGYCQGNVLKYVSRFGKKNEGLEDLKKARWYLDRLIQHLEQEARNHDHPPER